MDRTLRAFTGLLKSPLLVVLVLPASASVWAQPVPSFEELEAAGARVGEVRVVTKDIFDTADPKENNFLFRLANRLHIQTRRGVIERALLFKPGDPLSVRQLEETERILRTANYLYDVQFRPLAYHDGLVDIEVATRDTWSLDLGVSAGRSGGANSSSVRLKDYNLLGTGVTFGLARSNNVDRSSNELEFLNERAFGSWTSIGYSLAQNSDGRLQQATVERPFYELDARWAAGVTASKDNRIDSIYNAGNVVSQYRRREDHAEVYGGWSDGLVNGWVRRYSLGLSLQDDRFAPEPGRVAPAELRSNEKLVGPFFRFELLEDRYEKLQNRNLIGRPEFFALGLISKAQLGWAAAGLGSRQDTLLYTGSVSRGFEVAPEQILIGAGKISGQYDSGGLRRQRVDVQTQYYRPQGKRWLFYAAASGSALSHSEPNEQLLLGGDNGLRGYPLRYQAGQRRALFTVEERFYTDLYVFRLFRIGGAAFFDMGRAWGGSNVNTVKPGWLGNAGVGLRIVSVRSAFSNVLHVDLAVPINAPADIKKVQFLVKTKTSF